MDSVARVRELSALYRKYTTQFDIEKIANFWVPNYQGNTIYMRENQCCPVYNAIIIFIPQDYQCFDDGARLLKDGIVMLNSTCIYSTGDPKLYGFKYTQYWRPTAGICNYKLDHEIVFDLRCTNFNATCAE